MSIYSSIRNTRKKQELCSKLLIKIPRNVNEVALMFFIRCFSVFIVNFKHVNIYLDSCCIATFFKTYLKSLAKNEYFWLVPK